MLKELSINTNAIVLDNGTLREALTAIGLWTPARQVENTAIKVFDSYIASAELLIESLLLHEHIYIPELHLPDYNVLEIIHSEIGNTYITGLQIQDTELEAIVRLAERDFAKWPISDSNVRKRLREFSGVEASIAKWDQWILSCCGSAPNGQNVE